MRANEKGGKEPAGLRIGAKVLNGLPDDDLCIENAVILRRANRYCLAIDPAGHAMSFLEKEIGKKTKVGVSRLGYCNRDL